MYTAEFRRGAVCFAMSGWSRVLAQMIGAAMTIVTLGCSAQAAEPYVLNAILPLTGPVSFVGTGEQRALQLLERATNSAGGIQGRQLHFVFKDDESNPQTAVQLANELISQGVSVILGPSTVAECNAVAPLLLRSGPVLYCASPGFQPPKGSYAFTTYVGAQDLVDVSLRYLRLRGWKRVALLTSTDASGQEAAADIKAALKKPENKDMVLLTAATFNPTDISAAAQIEHIKAAQPQALIVWTTGAPTAIALKGLFQGGLTVPTVISASNMTLAQMTQYKQFLPKDMYLATSAWPPHAGVIQLAPQVEARQKAFYDTYKAAGLVPDGTPTYIWDAAAIVIDALRQIGPSATPTQIRDYIASRSDYAGINGVYDFSKVPQRGLSEVDCVMTTWDSGARTWRAVSKPGGIPVE